MSAPSARRFAGPEHEQTRAMFRIAGPLLLLLGVGLAVAGVIEFADDWEDVEDASRARATMPGLAPMPESPGFPWLLVLGAPIAFAGLMITSWGFMGAMARYQANEVAPVAADTVNYLAHETRPGVRAIAGAAREGLAQASVRCPSCGTEGSASAQFCKGCGAGLAARCAGCGRGNAADARFCEGCGGRLAPARSS